MTWLKELKEGDTVFFANSDPRRTKFNGEATVAKVGRKWLTIYGGYRFDRNQDVAKGYARHDSDYGSPSSIYPSQQHYNKAVEMRHLKNRISNELGKRNMTDDQVLQIAEILGVRHNLVTAPEAPNGN